MTNEWEHGVIVPIKIREDYFVRIGRIPHDLTPAEAELIGRVLAAYAQGMSAGTAEPVQPAQGEARQPGPKDAPDIAPETRP